MARWLGTFHKAVANLDMRSRLPDRGPGHHKVRLQSTLNLLPTILDTCSLELAERTILESILEKSRNLEKQWCQIEGFCSQIPYTVIHGDCLRKNMHIRVESDGKIILPLDWSAEGWGPLGLDLGHSSLPYRDQWPEYPDVFEYFSSINNMWPRLELKTVQQLQHLGRLMLFPGQCQSLPTNGRTMKRYLPIFVSMKRYFVMRYTLLVGEANFVINQE